MILKKRDKYLKEILPYSELIKWKGSTKFNSKNRRRKIGFLLFNKSCNYPIQEGCLCLLRKLKLIHTSGNMTNRGLTYLFNSFSDKI